MIKETLFNQTRWVSVAVVLAGLQIVFAIGIAADSEATNTERLFIFLVWGGSAVLALLGIQQRPQRRRRGDVLIALGVVPAVIGGVIFFWFPPLWLTTAAGIWVMSSAIWDAMAPVGVAASYESPR